MTNQYELFDLIKYEASLPVGDYWVDVEEPELEWNSSKLPNRKGVTSSPDSLTSTKPVSESSSKGDSPAENKPPCSVNIYTPNGTARGENQYYRLTYRKNGRVHHLHIPGGNITKTRAQARAQILGKLIDEGKPLDYILVVVYDWKVSKLLHRGHYRASGSAYYKDS